MKNLTIKLAYTIFSIYAISLLVSIYFKESNTYQYLEISRTIFLYSFYSIVILAITVFIVNVSPKKNCLLSKEINILENKIIALEDEIFWIESDIKIHNMYGYSTSNDTYEKVNRKKEELENLKKELLCTTK